MDYSKSLKTFFETFPIYLFFILGILFIVFSCNYFMWREIEKHVDNDNKAEKNEKKLWDGKSKN